MAIDPATVATLRAWKAVQNADRLLMGVGWLDRTRLAFTNADGGGFWPQTVTARFKEISDGLGLPSIGARLSSCDDLDSGRGIDDDCGCHTSSSK